MVRLSAAWIDCLGRGVATEMRGGERFGEEGMKAVETGSVGRACFALTLKGGEGLDKGRTGAWVVPPNPAGKAAALRW